MRVREMFYLVNHALEAWVNPIATEQKGSGGTIVSYSCKNAPALVRLLEPLRPFPEIETQIEIIYSTHNTFYKGVTGAFTPSEWNQVCSALQKIKSSLTTMQSMCAALGLDQNSLGFDIKLPPNISLAELSECSKDLNNIFAQCPLLHKDNEDIKLHGVDIGSIWLTFTVICAGSATGFYILKNLAAMVDEIIAIREHMAILKRQEEMARQAELKNEALQSVVSINKEITKSLMQNAAERLAAKNEITAPEDIECIRGTLDMLKEWVDKGMEVYAAIDTPSEIKAVFPPLERQALPKFEIKELEPPENAGEE